MEQAQVDGLREKLAALKAQARDIKEAAGGFPAIDRNTARIEASLNMMAVALGESALDES